MSARDPRDVAVNGDTIRLGQFLKLADLVDTGADAKSVLAESRVTVNGEVEGRRGRQLVRGDVVVLDGQRTARVSGPPRGRPRR